jgi:hypothetical protein
MNDDHTFDINKNEPESSTPVTAPELPEHMVGAFAEAPPATNAHFQLGKKAGFGILAAILVLGIGTYVLTQRSSTDAPVAHTQAPTPRFGVAVGLVEGTAEYSGDAGATWQPVTADTTLAEKNQVRTTDGRVVLLIDDGSAVRLGNNSQLELTSLETASIVVTTLSGEVYNRVVAADSRQYQAKVGDQTYTAKGTAYRTFNTTTKKGAEVYHSTVKAEEKNTDISEGNALFTLSEQKEKENIVSAIDLTALKEDAFLKWNSDQDKKSAEFAAALGVLVAFDKPDPEPAPTPAPAPAAKSGITLSAKVTEYTANFSWKISGIDTSKGYKLVKSKSSQTPTYPNDSAAFIEASKSSYSLYLGDGKTYYFRICAYRDDACESYSNAVTVTTPVKQKEQIVTGSVTLNAISGGEASWNFNGTAPYGFKLVINSTGNPTYPSTFNKFSDGQTAPIPDGLNAGDTYYARVCKYSYDGSCVDYSNEVNFIAP